MSLFSSFDVYERRYTYDEMKVMNLIAQEYQEETNELDYEDVCRIVEAVYAHWADDEERYKEKVDEYPWIDVNGDVEYGYIQAYAKRVLPEFIFLYKIRGYVDGGRR